MAHLSVIVIKILKKSFFQDEDIKLAKDEFLLMKTRIRHGKASFEDVDVQFKFANFHIPQDFISGFTEKDGADLFIISGAAKNVRLIVKRESAFRRLRESVNTILFSRSFHNL